MTAPLFDLRPGRPSDHAFVVDSWLTSNAKTARARDMLEAGIYWTEHKATVRRLLDEQLLLVAFAPPDEDAILGWACISTPPPGNPDPIVYYVYVRGKGKQSARRCGIARELLSDFLPHACTYTHRPAHGRVPVPETWLYNPERNYR